MLADVGNQYTATPPSCSPARNRRTESAAYGHIGRCFQEHAHGLYVPIRRHHRQRRARGSQGDKPGAITIRATGETQPGVSGSCSFWNARRPMEDHAGHVAAVAGAVGGGCSGIWRVRHPDRARSASACGRRARRGAGGHVDLPARTGAVQVDVGGAGGHRGLGGVPSQAGPRRVGWRGRRGGGVGGEYPSTCWMWGAAAARC